VRGYCWDSLASLYAFPATFMPGGAWFGIVLKPISFKVFPEFTQFFSSYIATGGPKEFRAALYH
jgi:hypothetical protein